MTEAALYRGEFYFLLGIVGAVVGSFLNVCIYRLPLGRSVVMPRSACPSCGEVLRAWHNIPVISWLLLRGRCAFCGAPISPRYPAVELLNAAVWLLAGWRFGVSLQTLLLLPLLSALIVLFFTDYDHKLLPDAVTFPIAGVGILAAPWNGLLDLAPGWLGSGSVAGRLAAAAAGAVLGYGIFFTLAVVWQMLFARDAMGGGDLKMMLGVGAFLGMGGVVVTIFLASVGGTLLSLPNLLTGRWRMTRELPFGCFLAPAAAFAVFFGDDLLRWYVGLINFP